MEGSSQSSIKFPMLCTVCRCVAYSPFCQHLQVYHISRLAHTHTHSRGMLLFRIAFFPVYLGMHNQVKCPKAGCKPVGETKFAMALQLLRGLEKGTKLDTWLYTRLSRLANEVYGGNLHRLPPNWPLAPAKYIIISIAKGLTRVLPVSPPRRSLLSRQKDDELNMQALPPEVVSAF